MTKTQYFPFLVRRRSYTNKNLPHFRKLVQIYMPNHSRPHHPIHLYDIDYLCNPSLGIPKRPIDQRTERRLEKLRLVVKRIDLYQIMREYHSLKFFL